MRKEIRVPVLGIVVVAIAIGALLLAAQFLPLVLNRDSSASNKDGLYLSGTETIKVLSPDGKVVSTWTGPDPLTNIAINALAACIPGTNGGSTDPIGPGSVTGASGSCSSFINAVAIVFAPGSITQYGGTCSANAGAQTLNGYSVTGCQATTTATNYLTPLNCGPDASTVASPPPLCTGWITQATFGPGTFTSTNCIYNEPATPCSVVSVDAGVMSQISPYPVGYGYGEGFDSLSPTPIAVAAGDSLLVTIQFTVS